jgi:hypothetical protein
MNRLRQLDRFRDFMIMLACLLAIIILGIFSPRVQAAKHCTTFVVQGSEPQYEMGDESAIKAVIVPFNQDEQVILNELLIRDGVKLEVCRLGKSPEQKKDYKGCKDLARYYKVTVVGRGQREFAYESRQVAYDCIPE